MSLRIHEHDCGCKMRVAGFTPAMFLLAACLCSAAAYEKSAGPARLQIDRTTIPLLGEIVVRLSVEGGLPLEVDAMGKSEVTGWQMTPLAPPAWVPLPDQRVRWQQSFRLKPVQPGKQSLILPPFRYRELGQTDWMDQRWEAIPVEVTTKVKTPSLSELQPITPIEQVPAKPAGTNWLAWLGMGTLVAGLAGLGVWLLRRRPKPLVADLPADQWTLRELERIESLGLPAAGQIERYHTLLGDVLRRYFELRFELPALEQTTAEFLDGLRQSSVLPAGQQEQLREFLEHCDLAKFARAEYSVEDCRRAALLVREFVAQTSLSPQ